MNELRPSDFVLEGGRFAHSPTAKERKRAILERARAWEQRFIDHDVQNARAARALANQALAINYRTTSEVTKYLGLFRDAEATLRTCLAHCAGANS